MLDRFAELTIEERARREPAIGGKGQGKAAFLGGAGRQ